VIAARWVLTIVLSLLWLIIAVTNAALTVPMVLAVAERRTVPKL